MEMLFNPLFFIPNLFLVVLDYLLIPFYFSLVNKKNKVGIFLLLIYKPISLCFCIFFFLTQNAGGLFIGSWYGLLSFPLALGLMIHFSKNIQALSKNQCWSKSSRFVLSIFGIILIISTCLSSILSHPVESYCDKSNKQNILKISQAIQKYYTANGEYPHSFDQLTEEYLEVVPTPSCSVISGFTRDFRLTKCDPPNIYISTLDGLADVIFDPKNGTVIRIVDFLDWEPSDCSKN
jgi:hypothetical protein